MMLMQFQILSYRQAHRSAIMSLSTTVRLHNQRHHHDSITLHLNLSGQKKVIIFKGLIGASIPSPMFLFLFCIKIVLCKRL